MAEKKYHSVSSGLERLFAMPNSKWAEVGALSEIKEEFEKHIIRPIKDCKRTKYSERKYLLCGPPGTGKTMIVEAVANETKANFIHVKGHELINKDNAIEVKTIFSLAMANTPCIVFFDELDAVTALSYADGALIFNQLIQELDDAKEKSGIFVICAVQKIMDLLFSVMPVDRKTIDHSDTTDFLSNAPKIFDPKFLDPFGKRLRMPFPNTDEREHILKAQARRKPMDAGVDLMAIAKLEACEELNNSDLYRLIEEAEKLAREKAILAARITMADLVEACKVIEPSYAMKFLFTVPTMKWSYIEGLIVLKEEFETCIIGPIRNRKMYEYSERKFLLWGPSGCGKTLIVEAVANEAEAKFIHVKGHELVNKGDAIEVKKIFRRAMKFPPCIVFFDELEALTQKHGKEEDYVYGPILNQLVKELEDAEGKSGVFVFGATNRFDLLDYALKKAFSKHRHVSLPNAEEVDST